MKKFLSALLVVLMLASISTLAFAAPSPSQDPEPVLPVVPTPKEKEKESEEAEEAEEAEEEATKTIEENKTVAEDEQGKQVVVSLGKLSNDATGQMKKDHNALLNTLVDAKKAVAENEKAAIPEEIKADFAKAEGKTDVSEVEGKTLVVGQPFRAVASEYPATITIKVENPSDFVAMMIFVNGKWVKLNTVVNEEDETITFVLDQPEVVSIVSQVVSAA